MAHIRLRTPLADSTLASRLAALIERLEADFTGCITGCFLFGSRANATAVPESDLDLVLVTAPDTRPGTRAALKETCVRHGRELGLPAIDLIVFDHETLLAKGHFRVKSCSVHLWGDDIRPAMPDLPFGDYLRIYAHAPIAYMIGVLRHTDRLFPPVSHPDPGDEFYGYSQPTLPPGNTPIPNVLALVATACWIASVLVSMRTGRTVASKAEAVGLYRDHVGDTWTDFIEEMYRFGNRRLAYLVPSTRLERGRLRRLCQEMPGLENHFLEHYRDYLLGELERGSPRDQVLALQRLAGVAFPDGEVTRAVDRYRNHPDDDIRRAAAQVIRPANE